MLYDHHHYIVLEHFHHPKQKPHIYEAANPCSVFPQPLETTNLLSVSTYLSVLDILHKWNHMICDLFCPTSFTYHDAFKVRPCYSMDQCFIPS